MFQTSPTESVAEKIVKSHKKGKGSSKKHGVQFGKLKKPAPKSGKKLDFFKKMGTANLNEG